MSYWDWSVVAVYLAGVIAAGIWFGRQEQDMEDYFLGGRRIPWWAALLSMVATEISAATFLGAPEQGYTRDNTYLQFGIGSILARFVLAFLFIGIFYRLRVYTVYRFLAYRFGMATKNYSAGLFLIGRFFAGGSRLFIASLAVKVCTGLDMMGAILVLGTISVIYTLFGGIKAVIWTDVVQAVILSGGALLCIIFLMGDIPLSAGETLQFLRENEKLRLLDTRWHDGQGGLALFSNPYHFIPAILGGFFLTMATHGTDQTMIQRLLTCKDSYRGKLSMVLSGFVGIGVTCLFLLVGLLLFVYVANLPEGHSMLARATELKSAGRNDHFFLYYILHGLPTGAAGIIIASVVAAAMSSIDSELNAMSATFVNDFYQPYFSPRAGAAKMMKAARFATLAFGLLLMGMALLITDFYNKNPQTDLLSIALGVMTFFYGGLLGVFLVGLLTRGRGNGLSNGLGMLFSLLLIVFISYKTRLLPALGLYRPEAGGDGFWAALYHFRLGWPWFIVIGTLVTVSVALLGLTARSILKSYRALDEQSIQNR